MPRALLAVATTLFFLMPGTAADAQPDNIELVLNASSYGYVPVRGVDYLIDQPQPSKDFKMSLAREDQRLPFGGAIAGWRGTQKVVLKDGYHLRVNARYLQGEPQGDFKGDKPGLSLDVWFHYDKQLIGFQSVTRWAEPSAPLEVTAELKDIAYFDLLSRNDFELPAVTDGYGEGFRAWAAIRDGMKNRDKKECTYESLTECLKPLGRKDNLMIPTVSVTAKVKQAP